MDDRMRRAQDGVAGEPGASSGGGALRREARGEKLSRPVRDLRRAGRNEWLRRAGVT